MRAYNTKIFLTFDAAAGCHQPINDVRQLLLILKILVDYCGKNIVDFLT